MATVEDVPVMPSAAAKKIHVNLRSKSIVT